MVVAVGRLAAAATGDVAVVAHGAVGTLLLCTLFGCPSTGGTTSPARAAGTASTPDPSDGRRLATPRRGRWRSEPRPLVDDQAGGCWSASQRSAARAPRN
ncbi:MAG: hypothetical protein JHC71_14535, partial [Blastococcus sp.]|nr:hypothetical protein [Blastococcus sp.]